MFTGSTKNPPPKSPQPDRLDEVYAALRRGLQSYLQVHQLELDSLGQQIRESKRNGRLGFLYELDKQVKAIERFMRRLEFHLSKVEELYDAYCMQRRLRDGASKMVAAFNSASGSKEARESLSEANRGYREYTEHMCSLESELEGQMGEFHIKMKGLAGFARLCAGDQYEVLMRAGRQRWRLRGRVEGSGRQVWDSEEYVFLPLITEMLSIKVTELKSLANHVVVGSVSCETLDLFCPLPQTVAVDINDLGTVKLNLEVTWSPFDKDDQTSSASTVSKRFLSNQSPPDTPSMREQVFYSLLKRQGELENGTVWSNSSESSDDSSSPAMGHHAHRMMATPTLQTTPTIQISFNPRKSSSSTPSLSSPRGEDDTDAAEGLGQGNSAKWTMPNGHSRSLSHIDDTTIDSIVTERPLVQSPGSCRIPEPLGHSYPEACCSGPKSEAWDMSECGAPEGFGADPENLDAMTQVSVLQTQKPGADIEATSALGEGLRVEQSSTRDNQRHQSTQPQQLGQGLRLPEETPKGRSHSRSSSFTQDIEIALESFDFLNGSDLEDEEGEEEELGEEELEEEKKLKEEEEVEKLKKTEEEEEELNEKEEEEEEEELKEEERLKEEELKEEELKEEEKEEEEELKEEEEEKKEELKMEEESTYDAESQECEGEDEIEIFVEAPEGFRNCDCAPSDEDDCLSQPQESIEPPTWREEGEEEEEEGEDEDKDDQEVEKDRDEEEKPQKETGDEGEDENEVTENGPSQQQLVEKTPPDEDARPLTPSHLATTVL